MSEPTDETLGTRLLRSHLLIAIVASIPLVATLGAIMWLQSHSTILADVRTPRVLAASRADTGLHRSTSALRGWMALEDSAFRAERAEAWREDIWPALDVFGQGLEDPKSRAELEALRRNLSELEERQIRVEDIANTPANEPARDRLTRVVDPIADAVATKIDEELSRARSANESTKPGVIALEELRHTFDLSRIALNRFVADGTQEHAIAFEGAVEQARQRLGEAHESKVLTRESRAWIEAEVDKYQREAGESIGERSAPTWNRSRHALEVGAVPLAIGSANGLRNLANKESEKTRAETYAVKRVSTVALVIGVVAALLMFVLAVYISRRASRRITEPVARLTEATERMRRGEQVDDVLVESKGEIGSLAANFNAMREALQIKEREFRLAVESSPAGILMVDEAGDILLVNERVEDLFGYARDELLGQPVTKLAPAGGGQTGRAGVVASFFANPGRREIGKKHELLGCRADGTTFPVEVALNPIDGPTGRAILASVEDVTQRREYDAQMRAARDAAEAANRAKSEFLATMSHELRTPLNSIIGFSKFLLKNKRGNLLERQLSHLNRIHDNGRHLLGLINEVLDLSKIEAGQLELVIEDVDLRPLVEGVVAELQGRADTANLNLTANLPDGALVAVLDPLRIKQVLINLVGNALKFTQEGEVSVRVIADPGSGRPAAIEVRDTGIGIPDDKLDHIFGAFQQADGTTAREFGGTGLGLAISRELCVKMGCAIEVESTVGVGTTFRVSLGPATTASISSSARTSAPVEGESDSDATRDQPATTMGRTVLVIDDDEDSRILIREAFEELGWHVELAADGPEGLRRARLDPPDVISVDLMMPAMNGWDVIRDLRDDPQVRDIPIVVISHVADAWRAALARDVVAVQKPVDTATLDKALHRAAVPNAGRVLVVDDDPDARELMQGTLAELGYHVDQAEDGLIGLEMMRTRRPDLVLLDLMMPRLDGIGVLNRMTADEELANIRVIVVTAKELEARDRERLKQVNVVKKGAHLIDELQQALGGIDAMPARGGGLSQRRQSSMNDDDAIV